MVDSAGSDDGDDAGDSELPPPPQPGQQPVGVPNDADRRNRGVAKAVLVLAFGVFVVPLLGIGGLVLLFAGIGDDFVDEGFAEDPDQRVLSSLDDGIETGFARSLGFGPPDVLDVVLTTDGPTTVVVLNPSPSEPSLNGRTTRVYVQGDEVPLGHGDQYTLSTREDCVVECTVSFTAVDPYNLHVLGSRSVLSLEAMPAARTTRRIDDPLPQAIPNAVRVCVNNIPRAPNAQDLQFVSASSAGGNNNRSEATQRVDLESTTGCQAEIEIRQGAWTGAILESIDVDYFGPEPLERFGDVSIQITEVP